MTEVIYLHRVVAELRLGIVEASIHGGPEAGLMAIAEASLLLAPLVAEGELPACMAWDEFQEAAENMKLVERFGQDAVQEAIAFGPRVYSACRAAENARAA